MKSEDLIVLLAIIFTSAIIIYAFGYSNGKDVGLNRGKIYMYQHYQVINKAK